MDRDIAEHLEGTVDLQEGMLDSERSIVGNCC